MKNLLLNLNYKRVCDYESDEKLHSRIEYLINDYILPPDTEFYVKILEQEITYEMNDGSEFTNTISLTVYFLINENQNELHDCFTIVSYPFEMRTEQDFNALQSLFQIYRKDLQQIYEYQQTKTDA